jgi:hypothetical protein
MVFISWYTAFLIFGSCKFSQAACGIKLCLDRIACSRGEYTEGNTANLKKTSLRLSLSKVIIFIHVGLAK